MVEIQAPNPLVHTSGLIRVFLAGSIEMGKAEDWQSMMVQKLTKLPGVLFNPRRDDWDSSWEQKAGNSKFAEQVTWEQEHIKASDIVFFYFAPGTTSPITLMEFGQVIGNKECIVCCPEGFWRKGNVDIVCASHNVKVHTDMEQSIEFLRYRIIELTVLHELKEDETK